MSNILKCPLCQGTIKKIEGIKTKQKSRPPMIKCENNKFKDNKPVGCTFIMNLAPKPLQGYELNREEIAIMIDGGEVDINGYLVHYDATAEYNPVVNAPELKDF